MRIHRGAHEVGGSCVELECAGRRLVLDVGLPLAGKETELPAIAGLAEGGDPSLEGVLISHGHPDHYGLAERLHADVRVYLGEATARILSVAAFFTPRGAVPAAGFLRDRVPLQLGPFRITPILVDHSAFDAYALLVEAGGRRLFYSGDLRGHGRKRGSFERLLSRPPANIDALLMEGTHVGRGLPSARSLDSEVAVEERALEVFQATPGMAPALYSPQNVDRLVSLFKAARRAGRLFVLDLYAAEVAAATGRPTIPGAGWEGVQVFVPQAQRLRVRRGRAFERTQALRTARIYPEELADQAGRLVMTFRESMRRDLERAGCLEGAGSLWSQWPGYLEERSGQALQKWLRALEIPLTVVHASGHATVADLGRLIRALKAAKVVPIHTAAPERFTNLFENVELEPDGQWWSV